MPVVGPNAELTSDLDGDGLTLLEEFAFRKDPTSEDKSAQANYSFSPITSPYEASGPYTLAFGARRDAPLLFRGQFSSDLHHWTPGRTVTPFLTDDSDDANSVFLISDPEPNPGPNRFGRISIEYLQSIAR